MELRQLKYFVKAAETLNFSEAAKQLAITQSTLSQQIRQLETELDARLFERNSHEVTLTEEGSQLLPAAMSTINAAKTCYEKIQDLKDMISGCLNIGVTYSFSPILTETVLDFMKKYPHVSLNIYYKTMEELMEMLRRREVDFVLAFRPTQTHSDIESHILFDNHLSVITRLGHPLSGKHGISLAELEKWPMALPAKGLQARNAFETLIAGKDHRYRVRIELNEVNILLKLVKNSDMITILSEATIHDTPGVKAIPITADDNSMAGCVHILKNSYHKHSATMFMKMLCHTNAFLQRQNAWFEG